MTLDLNSLAWHRSIGKLIIQLDRPEFWNSLTRLLNEYVQIDNWVVLTFSDQKVQIISFPEHSDNDEYDALTRLYIKGLYLLDPFYIHNRENPKTGFFHLLDIAPAHFLETEYYKKYFAQYVFADEAQYNMQVDAEKTLCLSFGSKKKLTQEQIVTLEIIEPWVTALMQQRMHFECDIEKNPFESLPWLETITQLGIQITARETDVLKLLLSGYSNKQIAGKLTLSTETIKVHRRNIYTKLNINSQSELFSLFFMMNSEATHRNHAV